MNKTDKLILFSIRSFTATPAKNQFCHICKSPIELGNSVYRKYASGGAKFTCVSCHDNPTQRATILRVEKAPIPIKKDVLLIYLDGVLVPQLKHLLHGSKGEVPVKGTPDPNGPMKWRKCEVQ